MPERRLSILLLSPLLTLGLGAFILSTALHQTIGSADQTKSLIHQSGLYQAVIPQQVADSVKNNPTLSTLPLNDPKIQKVLGTALDSHKVQSEGDQAVDGIYSWLEGKSSQPNIAIDVSPDASSLADAASKYAAALPVCAPGQNPGTDIASDPLSASCLPAGVSMDMIRSFVAAQIDANPALTASPKLTQDDIKLTDGKTIMDAFSWAPAVYHWAQLVPLISAAVAAISALLIIAILKPLRGFRSVGKHLLSVGITLGVISFLLAWAIEKGASAFLPKSDNPNVGDAITKLTNLFDASYRDNIIHLSVYVAGAGLVLYLVAVVLSMALKHRHAPQARPKRAANRVKAMPEPESLDGASNSLSSIPSAPPLPKTRVAHHKAARKAVAKKPTRSARKPKA